MKIFIALIMILGLGFGKGIKNIDGYTYKKLKLDQDKFIKEQTKPKTKKLKPKKSKKSKNFKSKKLIRTAKKYLGVRYRYGGCTKKGMDCSGFVKTVYKKHGKNLPRTSRNQAKIGKHVKKNGLQMGDLVFFRGTSRRSGGITHVGIYLGKGNFIHASSGAKKVTISKLNKTYYKKHYAGARRLI